jgi:hypothetical protein
MQLRCLHFPWEAEPEHTRSLVDSPNSPICSMVRRASRPPSHRTATLFDDVGVKDLWWQDPKTASSTGFAVIVGVIHAYDGE